MISEEPGAGNLHAGFCGGRAAVMPPLYPETGVSRPLLPDWLKALLTWPEAPKASTSTQQ